MHIVAKGAFLRSYTSIPEEEQYIFQNEQNSIMLRISGIWFAQNRRNCISWEVFRYNQNRRNCVLLGTDSVC